MRDGTDNAVVVCSIENVDPMGVHTGDSMTVAPAMTLTDREYQRMRDLGLAILREVGVATGGCNIQFAVNPANGRIIVIEMNPRVSRSSALASKATGFPIAKIAAKLAIGYTLDEIANDITKATPAAFEPSLDYVVVKIPRFAFEKFPGADPDADHHDEVGGRGDVDRPVVRRGAGQGDALDGDQAGRVLDRARSRPTGDVRRAAGAAEGAAGRPDLRRRAGAGLGRHRRAAARGDRDRPVVPRPDRPDPRDRRRGARRRRADRRPAAHGPSATACPIAQIAALRPESRLAEKAVRRAAAGRSASARSTRRWTPARPSSRPARRTTTRPTRPIRRRSPRWRRRPSGRR